MMRFMMGMLYACALLGCNNTGVRELQSVAGIRVYEAKCKGSGDACWLDAHQTCSGGYELIDSESHSGGLVGDALPGPVTWSSMTFICSRTGEFERPAFASRGRAYQPPAAVAPVPPQAGSQPWKPTTHVPTPLPDQPTITTRGCSSDFECGGPGYACAKAAGSMTGQCGRVVNQFGTQDFSATPRTNSIGPGKRQCSTMTDCGIGFTCDQGICLKR